MKADSNAAENVIVTSSQILMLRKCVHCSPCYFSHTLLPCISRLRDAPPEVLFVTMSTFFRLYSLAFPLRFEEKKRYAADGGIFSSG